MNSRDATRLQGSADTSAEVPAALADADRASQEFVGRWNRLVSTTNWEKGRIILQWRESLIAVNATPQEYADEAWSRRVGGVTGQHVGRLRRVYQRFGSAQEKYAGLYWSHFQAAVDWDDAEMWLEGAVQSQWSVNAMRGKRWETLAALAMEEPVVESELDEDFEPALNQDPEAVVASEQTEVRPAAGEDAGVPEPELGPAAPSEEATLAPSASDGWPAEALGATPTPPTALIRPFATLPELPDDVAGAFEAYKVAILYHKREQWREISRDDLLASLDALRQLALAPAGDAASPA